MAGDGGAIHSASELMIDTLLTRRKIFNKGCV